jgi:Protein of unknown function (DUF3455)
MSGLCGTGVAALVLLAASAVAANAELPDAIAAKGEVVILEVHAEGAQIYECKPDAGGQLTWQFREPVASLFRNGATVGRHYAGPSWEIGGSTVVGKAAGRAPGATPKDILWLKLDVSDRHGDGPLKDATTVQRINTKGGNLDGKCDEAGDLQPESYGADYVFLRKGS